MTASARAAEEAAAEPLAVALEAAHAAGALLRRAFAGEPSGVRAKATPIDLVSRADEDAERAICERLAARRPGDGVLAEEGTRRPSSTGLRWIVDPLDGTTNFLWRIPHFAVSVACEDDDGPLAAVVHDPLRGETFAATRDGPATLAGAPLSGPPARPLAEITVAGDFRAPGAGRAADLAGRLFPAVGHVRSVGSAALDLAWAAAGRWDAAYHEQGFADWDVAAGRLLCERAGLCVRVLGPLGDGCSRRLVAAPARLADALVELAGGP